jgi:hypothetical protein
MSVAEQVRAWTTLRVWSTSRDSRVGIATPAVTKNHVIRYNILLLNQPDLKLQALTEEDLNTQWVPAPRVDAKWVNPGSVWVRNELHQNWKHPVPIENRVKILEVNEVGTVIFLVNGIRHFRSYFEFIPQYTRLWGAETPRGQIPTEPLPFRDRKSSGRPKTEKPEPKSALERLLERDLLSE